MILFPLERLRTEIQKIRKNYDDLNDLYLHHFLEQKALRSDLSEEEILRSFHCLQDFLNARIAGQTEKNPDIEHHEEESRRMVDIFLYGILERE